MGGSTKGRTKKRPASAAGSANSARGSTARSSRAPTRAETKSRAEARAKTGAKPKAKPKAKKKTGAKAKKKTGAKAKPGAKAPQPAPIRPRVDLRRLLDHTTDVIILMDGALRVVFVNQTLRPMFGRDPETLLGKTVHQIGLPRELSTRWDGVLREVLATGLPHQLELSPLLARTPDGTPRHYSAHLSPARAKNGSVTGVVFVSRDITELYRVNESLQKAERSLRESEARYRSVVEDQTEIVSRVLPDGTLTFVNDVYCRFFGKSREEILGSRWHPTAHPEDLPRIEEGLAQLTPESSVVTIENRVYDGTGRERWMEFVNRGFFSAEGRLLEIQAVGRDITVRKQLESERQILEAQKMDSLGMLAGGIAHDFNNLLTGILGSAALARNEIEGHSEAHSHLDRIEMATQRAAELCRQLLAYAGKGRLTSEPVELSYLIQDVLSLLKMTISKKAVLHLELTPGLPPFVGDPTQIRQILMNLVINASDAIGNKSGLIIISTGLVRGDRAYLDEYRSSQPLPEADYVYLEVRDNGCGMSAETRARIFEPFFTTKFTGRGLGLAAVLGIVRSHKAGIKVYSELGKGSSFKMLFPCAPGSAATTQPMGRFARYRGHGTVLVVDDEESVRAVTARILETFGFQVVLAEDGRDALTKLALHQDLRFILMDLTMPHLSGEEALRYVRGTHRDLPIILMSGYSPEELQLRFGGKGFAGFLQKPFRPSDMMVLLEKIFGAQT
jgi:PAS domain S-box-containing protein